VPTPLRSVRPDPPPRPDAQHEGWLADLVDDDRAILLGAFLDLAGRLRAGDPDVRT
jgi:hypothetical protein